MFQINKVEKFFHKALRDGCDRGSYAYFVRMNRQWGLKFFPERYKKKRDISVEAQTLAYRYQLGPEVGPSHDFTGRQGRFFGYITEVARPYRSPTDIRFPYKVEDLTRVNREYRLLKSRLEWLGICTNDMDGKNVGYLASGLLVCIDFSEAYPDH